MSLIHFNYKVQIIDYSNLEKALNELKQDNWELYQLTRGTSGVWEDYWTIIARKAI